MAEPDKKQNFWTTLPGLLTGLAALLTAVTGFLVVMHPRDVAGGKEPAVVAGPVDSGTGAPGAGGGTATSSPSPAKQGQKPTVLVTSKDGTESRVFLNGFRDSYSGEAIQLKNGQSIRFDKIRSVDFLETHDYEQDVRVTLTDGRALEGTIMSGEQLTGDTDIGPFSISVKSLKLITFER